MEIEEVYETLKLAEDDRIDIHGFTAKSILDFIKQQKLDKKAQVCEWGDRDNGIYRPNCDEGIGITISSLYIDYFKFCPCCGAKIKIKDQS